jgi:hypothetical protein
MTVATTRQTLWPVSDIAYSLSDMNIRHLPSLLGNIKLGKMEGGQDSVMLKYFTM